MPEQQNTIVAENLGPITGQAKRPRGQALDRSREVAIPARNTQDEGATERDMSNGRVGKQQRNGQALGKPRVEETTIERSSGG